MNGLELAAAHQESGPPEPVVIMLSGFGDELDTAEGPPPGWTSWWESRWTLEKLRDVLAMAVEPRLTAMRPLDMPIRWSIGLAAVLLAALPGVAGRALATGAGEGGRRAIRRHRRLAPDGDLTRLRFFFRDFQTGRGLTEPMSVRVRIAEDEAPARSTTGARPWWAAGRTSSTSSRTTGLRGGPRVLPDGDPARVYRPEDWRIWVGKPRALDGRTWAWVTGTSTLLTMMVVLFLRRPRTERGCEMKGLLTADINERYAVALNYRQIDRFMIQVLWWHFLAIGLLTLGNNRVPAGLYFPSPSPGGSPRSRRARDHRARLLAARFPAGCTAACATTTPGGSCSASPSPLFVLVRVHQRRLDRDAFHFFMIMALLVMYSDWRLGWLVLVLTALHHGVLNYLQPSWVYFYGRNDFAIVRTACPSR